MNVRHARKTTLQESIEQALRSAGTLENRRVERTSVREEQARVSACTNGRASQNETLTLNPNTFRAFFLKLY